MNTLIGASKSKTVWFGALLAVLPFVNPVAAALSPILGAKVVSVIGVVVIALRAVTDQSLADKAQ